MSMLSLLRRRPWRVAALAMLVGFVGLNVLAYRHAYTMLHYADGGERTGRPQTLSLGDKLGVLVAGVRVPRPSSKVTPAKVGLTFETHAIDVEEGVTLEAWLVPAEQAKGTVALFHGYGGSKSSLLEEAVVFHDLGYETLLVDFRGSGGSSGRQTTIGYLEADDVAAAVAFVRDRDPQRPVILYGNSMGGAAILRSLAACDVHPDGVIAEAVFDRLSTTVGNRFKLMGLPSSPGSELLLFWGGVQSGFWPFGHNPVDYADHCECPALLLHGDRDRNAALEGAKAVQRNLPAGTRLEVFPDVGHSSTLAADPERWKAAVGRFLDDLDRTRLSP